jgi:hypothetical protein
MLHQLHRVSLGVSAGWQATSKKAAGKLVCIAQGLEKKMEKNAGASLTCHAKLKAHHDLAFSTLLPKPSAKAQGSSPLPEEENTLFCHAMGYWVVTFL